MQLAFGHHYLERPDHEVGALGKIPVMVQDDQMGNVLLINEIFQHFGIRPVESAGALVVVLEYAHQIQVMRPQYSRIILS